MPASIPRPEHPRPDFQRDPWINLNGEWDFAFDPGCSGEAQGWVSQGPFTHKIRVPFCPESPLSGIHHTDFMDCVWYRRFVTLPREWKDRRVLLHFGAVDYEATVWMNGVLLGTHRGGYVPFTLDATRAIKDGNNEIVVRAVDHVRSRLQPIGKQSDRYASYGCSYRRTTGIWQTVWLESAGPAYIEHVSMTPDLDAGRVVVQADVNGPADTFRVIVRRERRIVAETEAPARWRNTLAIVDVPAACPWSPTNPQLYDLEFILLRNGAEVDHVYSYFGFRKIHIDGNRVYLNDKLLFQRLVLDQGFYPDGIYTAKTDSALRRDIELSMAMGFNGARLHQKVFEPRFLYWADRMGYLCWGEFPSWGIDANSPEAWENLIAEWIEAVQRDRNHPSLIGWCPANETPNEQHRFSVGLLYQATRAIDPSRPIIDASGYTHVITDIDDNHDYTQDPAAFKKQQAPLVDGKPYRNQPNDAPYAGQPFICSEYGGIWWNPGQKDTEAWGYGDRPKSEKEFLTRFRGLTEALLKNPAMAGLCYTQLTDVEQEVNGLYTFDRKPKFDPALIAAILRQPAAMEENA